MSRPAACGAAIYDSCAKGNTVLLANRYSGIAALLVGRAGQADIVNKAGQQLQFEHPRGATAGAKRHVTGAWERRQAAGNVEWLAAEAMPVSVSGERKQEGFSQGPSGCQVGE